MKKEMMNVFARVVFEPSPYELLQKLTPAFGTALMVEFLGWGSTASCKIQCWLPWEPCAQAESSQI